MERSSKDVCTILLVDDDEGVRAMLSDFLQMHGYRVQSKSNGEEALAYYEECRPDLVVTDIDMPVMNGLELIRSIRSLDTSLPVMAISGDASHLIAAENLGAHESFVKPFNFPQFINSVKTLLS
jgi:DNA-binding response OmpR family regulator